MNTNCNPRCRAVYRWMATAVLLVTGLASTPILASSPAWAAASQLSSGAVHWQGATWRADAVQRAQGSPLSISVYRTLAGTWHLQGQVQLATDGAGAAAADLGATGQSLRAANLTGTSTPDFVIVTVASTQVAWFSVISAATGAWHPVPVDFGYRPLLGVPAKVAIASRLLRVQVQGQNYAPSTTGWFGYADGAFSPTGPPGPTPPCDVKDLGSLPSSTGEGQVPPSRYACRDGWALLSGTFEMSPYIELMNWQGSSGWQMIATGGQLDDAPMWYGLPLSTLQHLAASVGGLVAPVAAAAAIVSLYPQTAVEGYGTELPVVADTGVVYQYSQDWLAVAASAAPPSPISLDVVVYRWNGASWAKQGTAGIRYFYGDLDSSPGVPALVAEALTGGSAPDFTISASGADTHWFAVVSGTGGQWHGVPFDYAGGQTMAIDEAGISGSLVEAELDYCGCAVGPESYLWYRYSPARAEFLPTGPPGPPAACTAGALHQAVVGVDVAFTRLACVDGWAAAAGTEGTVKVLVLLEQQGTAWQAVNIMDVAVLNTHALAALTAEYLVPLSVRAQLATGLHIA